MADDPLVSTDWLQDHLEDPDLRVVDIRGYVTTRPLEPGVEEATYRGAGDEYLAGHIPGAVFVDWTVRHRRPGRPRTRPDRPRRPVRRGDVDARDRRRDPGRRRGPHGRPVRHPALVGADLFRPRRGVRPRRRLEPLGRGGASRRIGAGLRRPGGLPREATRRDACDGRRRPGVARPGRPPAPRRPRRRPVHGGTPPRPARRAHPGRGQPPSRALLRRRGGLPAQGGDRPPDRTAWASGPIGRPSPTATGAWPRPSCSSTSTGSASPG